jgi:hypothetical protein
MAKPKKIKEAVRLSVVISKEQADFVERMALRMGSHEGKQVTVSEGVRRAIETVYHIPKSQLEFF